ncbi:unnamed protein product, partial [Iphiclides podalirius]
MSTSRRHLSESGRSLPARHFQPNSASSFGIGEFVEFAARAPFRPVMTAASSHRRNSLAARVRFIALRNGVIGNA